MNRVLVAHFPVIPVFILFLAVAVGPWSIRQSDFLFTRAEEFRPTTEVSLWAPRPFFSRSPRPTAEEPAVLMRARTRSVFSRHKGAIRSNMKPAGFLIAVSLLVVAEERRTR